MQWKLSLEGFSLVPGQLGLIAGPCVIEGRQVVFETAERLVEICRRVDVPLIFKASYLKDNRSSPDSPRGPGIEEGLRVLGEVREKFGVPVTSDVHSPGQVERAARVLDLIQIPAFLCRQTSLMEACARSGKAINVKKGQFMAPEDMRLVLEKIRRLSSAPVVLTERGSCFGYHRLVVDMRSLPIMRGFGVPVCFDVTHSLQLPGGGESGGERAFYVPLGRAAVAAGCDLLFLEVHPDPARAWSDRATMVPLDEVEGAVAGWKAVHEAVRALGEGG